MMQSIQIVQQQEKFTKDSCGLREAKIPEPGEGEVLIKVHFAALNPVDYKVATFLPLGKILGCDGAGIIEKVGKNVTKFKGGERVFWHGYFKGNLGSFAEYYVNPEISTCLVPEEVTLEEATSVACAGMTAYQALIDVVRIQENELCVVTAGGVGSFGVQIAKAKKCKVIGVCSGKNFEFVKGLGADYVIDYNTEDVEAKIKEISNGRGVDVFFDCVSAELAAKGLKCLAFGGHLAFISGVPVLEGNWAAKQLSVHGVFLGMAYEYGKEAIANLGKTAESIIDMLKRKVIRVGEIQVVEFSQIPEALESISKQHTKGKIVAKIFSK